MLIARWKKQELKDGAAPVQGHIARGCCQDGTQGTVLLKSLSFVQDLNEDIFPMPAQ